MIRSRSHLPVIQLRVVRRFLVTLFVVVLNLVLLYVFMSCNAFLRVKVMVCEVLDFDVIPYCYIRV